MPEDAAAARVDVATSIDAEELIRVDDGVSFRQALVKSGKETLHGLAGAANFVWNNPGQVALMAWNGAVNYLDGITTDPDKSGRLVGNIILFWKETAIGGYLKRAADGLKTLGSVADAAEDTAEIADKLSDARRAADKAKDAAEELARKCDVPNSSVSKADDIYDATKNELKVLQDRCFAPETLVAIPTGPRPIGELRQGDLVLSYDHRAGEWSPRRVDVFHESIYEGPVCSITTDAGVIRATIYHPFWVQAGMDLDERSTPRELSDREDQGFGLEGRWVNSHELRCGDVLIGKDGRPRVVLRIDQQYESAFPVHNLTIEGHHTYAVGADAVLVHNTDGCLKGPKRTGPTHRHHSDPKFKQHPDLE